MHSTRDVDAPRATWEPPILGQWGDLEKLLSLGVKRGWPKKGSDGGCPGRGSFWVPPFDGLPCILRFLFFFLFFFFGTSQFILISSPLQVWSLGTEDSSSPPTSGIFDILHGKI